MFLPLTNAITYFKCVNKDITTILNYHSMSVMSKYTLYNITSYIQYTCFDNNNYVYW